MQIAELPPGAGECPEILGRVDARDAGKLLRQRVGVAFAIIGRVQQAVNAIENIILIDLLARIGRAETPQSGISDPVAAGVSVGCVTGE